MSDRTTPTGTLGKRAGDLVGCRVRPDRYHFRPRFYAYVVGYIANTLLHARVRV